VINEYVLVLVLIAIYLSECIFFPSAGATLLKGSIRGSRFVLPAAASTFGYRLAVESPLPQAGSIFVAEPAPPLISPSGVLCFSKGLENRAALYVDFADEGCFLSKDCSVSNGSELICASGTAEQAAHLSDLLTNIKASDMDKRDALITDGFRRMLDTRRAGRRWRAYQRAFGFLSLDSWVLFGAFVSLIAMIAFFKLPLVTAWPLAVLSLILVPHSAYVFFRVHLLLFPNKTHERWKQIALMILTPLACVRGGDFITRELFAGFHSLAVSRVLLDEAGSRSFTARTLRELIYPIVTEYPHCEAAEWAKRKWAAVVWEWSEQEFGDPQCLIHAPKKISEGCICYCPRCLAQYLFLRNSCSDCPGVTVRNF
jgi:hypothetical protein